MDEELVEVITKDVRAQAHLCRISKETQEFNIVWYRACYVSTLDHTCLVFRIDRVVLTEAGCKDLAGYLQAHRGPLLLRERDPIEFEQPWIRVWFRNSDYGTTKQIESDLEHIVGTYMRNKCTVDFKFEALYKVASAKEATEAVVCIVLYDITRRSDPELMTTSWSSTLVGFVRRREDCYDVVHGLLHRGPLECTPSSGYFHRSYKVDFGNTLGRVALNEYFEAPDEPPTHVNYYETNCDTRIRFDAVDIGIIEFKDAISVIKEDICIMGSSKTERQFVVSCEITFTGPLFSQPILSCCIDNNTLNHDGQSAFKRHLETYKENLLLNKQDFVEYRGSYIDVCIQESKGDPILGRAKDLNYIVKKFLDFKCFESYEVRCIYKARTNDNCTNTVAYIVVYDITYLGPSQSYLVNNWPDTILGIVERDQAGDHLMIHRYVQQAESEIDNGRCRSILYLSDPCSTLTFIEKCDPERHTDIAVYRVVGADTGIICDAVNLNDFK